MPDIEVPRLRNLRRRAAALLATLTADLKPFQSQFPALGFRRKPDSASERDDVNVTTTCSCLMSLAHSGKLGTFYGDNAEGVVQSIVQNLLNAPWMSSGLSEDNAFTTSLVIRLWGSLVRSEFLTNLSSAQTKIKPWEGDLSFADFQSFCKRMTSQKEPFCSFLFQLLPRATQKTLQEVADAEKYDPEERASRKRRKSISRALDTLTRTSIFYSKEHFAGVSLSDVATKMASNQLTDAYRSAQLNRLLLHEFFHKEIVPANLKSLSEIAIAISSNIEQFRINDYPAAAAVVYWFVDGVDHSGFELPDSAWIRLRDFATEEFRAQSSLVVAKHTAMMDPVATAMAACLCARLRSIGRRSQVPVKWRPESLPSTIELEHAVVDLFGEQTKSGLWPKYFPLFHYQDAGSNFCYTFELLEAVLVEFGGRDSHLFSQDSVISGLERAVASCEIDRLESAAPSEDLNAVVRYCGWNSGGNLETLRRGQPESWATAVVHMFLEEVVDVLSTQIQQELEGKYKVLRPSDTSKRLNSLLDISLVMKNPSLIGTLQETLIKSFSSFTGDSARKLRKTPLKNKAMSALLFGPPGTSKTQVAKAIAADLKWPLIEIDPSHFLQTTFQDIYFQAERIFEDVMDLCGVVVLFDEMDALVQKRGGGGVSDIEAKFLTTYMLPKLAKLHDQGQLMFLMATNFQEEFDDAIKRAGRFDLLLCMGPPTLKAKCENLHAFLDSGREREKVREAGALIGEYASTNLWLASQLALFTFGEFRSFIARLDDSDDIEHRIRSLGPAGFEGEVKKHSEATGLRVDDLNELSKLKLQSANGLIDVIDLDALDSVQFTAAQVKKKKIDMTLAIKYVLERKQSRLQM
jgi:hypothetical protein